MGRSRSNSRRKVRSRKMAPPKKESSSDEDSCSSSSEEENTSPVRNPTRDAAEYISGTRQGVRDIIDEILPQKSESDSNSYRVIVLSNGLRALLISTTSNAQQIGRNKRNFRETPSQIGKDGVPLKRSRSDPKIELTLREAIENRMLLFINECLLLLPGTVPDSISGSEPPSPSLVASVMTSVKNQIKELLTSTVHQILDEFFPNPSQISVVKPPQTSPSSSLTSEIKEILVKEVKGLIEEGRRTSAIGLIRHLGTLTLVGGLSESVRQVLFSHLGAMVTNYFIKKWAETVVEDSTSRAIENVSTGAEEHKDEEPEVVGVCGGLTSMFRSKKPDAVETGQNETVDPNPEFYQPSCWSNFGFIKLDLEDNNSMTESKIKLIHTGAVGLSVKSGSIFDDENSPGISDMCRKLLIGKSPCYLNPTATENTIFSTFTHLSAVEETKSKQLKSMLKCTAKLLAKPDWNKCDIPAFLTRSDQCGMMCFGNLAESGNLIKSKKILHLIYSLAKFDHPLRSISPSCYEPLRNTYSRDEQILESVQKFWSKNYRVERSTLAVQADEPLDTIECYVLRYFGDFERKPSSTQSAEVTGEMDPFDSSEFRRILRVLPDDSSTCNRRSIVLSWGLPAEYWKDSRGKSIQYISTVLSYKGPGSLFHFLFTHGLACSLAAECCSTDYHRNDFCSLFQISLELSQSSDAFSVIEYIFSYLKFLSQASPNKDIIRELRISQSISKASAGNPYNQDILSPTVATLSRALHLYSPETVLMDESDFNVEKIQCCLNKLCPEDVNVIIVSGEFRSLEANGVMFRREKYFGTKYTSEKIPDDYLAKWKNVLVSDTFKLPPSNSFNPEFLQMNSANLNAQCEVLCPVEIERNKAYTLWHMQDPKYRGMVVLNMTVSSPEPLSYAYQSANLAVMIKFLSYQLAEEFYDAQMWNSNLQIIPSANGFILRICAHKNRFTHLVTSVIKKFQGLGEALTEPEFQILKQWTLKEHQNKMFDGTILSENLFNVLSKYRTWKITEIYSNLKSSLELENLKQFLDFIQEFQTYAFLGIFLVGNFSIEESRGLTMKIGEILQNKGSPLVTLAHNYLLAWPDRSDVEICVANFDPNEKQTLLTKYYQLGLASLKSNVIANIVCHLMISFLLHHSKDGKWPNQTCEMNIYVREILGMLFFQQNVKFIASSSLTIKCMEKSMDDFVSQFYTKFLRRMGNDTFGDFCDCSLKAARNEKSSTCIQNEVKTFAKEMSKFVLNGMRYKQEMEIYETVGVKSVRKWYMQNLLRNQDCYSPSPPRLCIKVVPLTASAIGSTQCTLLGGSDLTSFIFPDMTCDEKRNEWNNENPKGSYIRDINGYVGTLLMHQIPLPDQL